MPGRNFGQRSARRERGEQVVLFLRGPGLADMGSARCPYMRRMLLERSGACAQRIGNDRLSPDAADIELSSVLNADPMREPNKARVCAEWAT